MVRRTLATIFRRWAPRGSNQGGGVGGPRRPIPESAITRPQAGVETTAGKNLHSSTPRGSERSSVRLNSTSAHPHSWARSPGGTGCGHQDPWMHADSQCSVSAAVCSCPPPRQRTAMPPLPPKRVLIRSAAVSKRVKGRGGMFRVYRSALTLTPIPVKPHREFVVQVRTEWRLLWVQIPEEGYLDTLEK